MSGKSITFDSAGISLAGHYYVPDDDRSAESGNRGLAPWQRRERAGGRAPLPNGRSPLMERGTERLRATNALPIPWVEPVDISNTVLWLASEESPLRHRRDPAVGAGSVIK
jgi:hypothetical protein